MAITFSGLATGLDTDSIVSDLMAIERAPVDRLEAQITYETRRLSAFSQLNSRLETLKSAVSEISLSSQVRTTGIQLSSEGTFSASSSGATTGSYDISVAQLAQVQKTISEGYSSKSDSVLGTGTITVNGVDIEVDSSNNSLSGLADSINAQSDETGVSVTILNDGSTTSPYHLVFTGSDATVTFGVTSSLTDELGDPVTFDTTLAKSAQQAVLFIDGLKVVSNSNTVSDAISNVTLNLEDISETTYAGTAEAGVDPWDWADPPEYSSTTMTVTPDTDALKEKITNFVSAYNGVMDWIKSGYNDPPSGSTSSSTESSESEGTDEEFLADILRGDSTVNTIKRSLQSILTDTIDNNGAFQILSEVGISTQLDGTLKQNNVKLDAALENDFEDIVSLFAGDNVSGGVMQKFNSFLLKTTSSAGGMYSTQKDAYDSSVKDLDVQIDLMESRMSKRESTLRAQFTVMEQLISGLNSQSNFLAQQLSTISQNS